RVRDREHPATRTHPAVERELAEEGVRAQSRIRELAARSENRAREREVDRRAGLRQVVRRQAGGDSPAGKLEPRVSDRRVDALARLAHCRVGEPHDREPGKAGAEVALDGYASRLHSVERERVSARKQWFVPSRRERGTLATAWDATRGRVPRARQAPARAAGSYTRARAHARTRRSRGEVRRRTQPGGRRARVERVAAGGGRAGLVAFGVANDVARGRGHRTRPARAAFLLCDGVEAFAVDDHERV